MILQAAINGARKAAEHAALPLTPERIVADSVAVLKAGANEIHLHLRNAQGAETLDPAAVDPLMKSLRAAVPGTLLGVSSGLWIEGDHARTAACIAQWSARPDYASLNIREGGAALVAEALLEAGIGIELGLFDEADVGKALAAGLVERAFRVLVEVIEPEPAAALGVADRMLAQLRQAGCGKSILLHGMEATMWPLFEMAAARGLSQRLGLEDGLALPDGATARDNAAIIAEGKRRIGQAGAF